MPSDDLKTLLLKEIEADERKVTKLREALALVEPRLLRAKAYFSARFATDVLPESSQEGQGPEPVTSSPKTRKRFGHADRCAVAITEAGKVGAPLSVEEIKALLVSGGIARADYPTRETLVSTVSRSPLFSQQGAGRFVLREPYPRGRVPAKHRDKLVIGEGTASERS